MTRRDSYSWPALVLFVAWVVAVVSAKAASTTRPATQPVKPCTCQACEVNRRLALEAQAEADRCRGQLAKLRAAVGYN